MPEQTRVLIAESDAISAQAMLLALRDKGVEVLAAYDAAHVMNLARDSKPDAVVLNARLAGGGVAALLRLRSNVYTTHIPVIGIADPGTPTTQMVDAGARHCFASPPDYEALHAAIRSNLPSDLDFTQAPKQALEEPARMADLEETGLLDSPAEESFDRLARLAAKLLNAPAALVSLVDRDRQFFKSQVGLQQPWAGARQTRLSHSFCQWVVSGRERLVVENAHDIPALKANLAVRDLGVIAYAGVPLSGRQGHAIGSFCAIDSKARKWSQAELSTLEDLAKIAQADAVGDKAPTSAVAESIIGAVRILQRLHGREDAAQRNDLLKIIQEQARLLAFARP